MKFFIIIILISNHLTDHEHDLYSQLLSVSEHFPNCIFGFSSRDTCAEYLLSEHGIYNWSPKQYGQSHDLLRFNFLYIHPSCKSIKFIETKVTAINRRFSAVF